LQGGANCLYVKWADFLMISAGQDSNIVVIQLKSLINLEIKSVVSVGGLEFFADFIAVFHK